MPIPDYQTIMLPLLKFVRDGQVHSKHEALERLAHEFEVKNPPAEPVDSLLGPQGIFKPKIIPQIPLSITTTPKGPYDDSFSYDDFLLYRYRGTDIQHRDNAGLRMAPCLCTDFKECMR